MSATLVAGVTIQSGLQDPELEEIALASLLAAEQSPDCLALVDEWKAMVRAKHMSPGVFFDARRDKYMRPVFIVRCNNGYHESLVSFEDAYRLLVEAHRPSVGDLEETHRALAESRGQDWDTLTPAEKKSIRKECSNAGNVRF
jgi:hypothetical protein